MKNHLLLLLLPILMAFDTPLENAEHEQRARALMNEIRCVACENEPISQSNADIASDMRDRVRDMIGAGATDAEVRQWFSDRYGEFVLFRPSTSGTMGVVLWSIPFGLLLIGGLGLAVARRRPAGSDAIEPVAPEAFDPNPVDNADQTPARDPNTQS